MQTEATTAAILNLKKGDKRGHTIKIMNTFEPGHVFEDCVNAIAAGTGLSFEAAASYYRWVVRTKTIPDYVGSKPTKKIKDAKAPATPKIKGPKATTAPKGGNPNNLDKLKAATKKMQNGVTPTPEEATAIITKLAGENAHHAMAEPGSLIGGFEA